MYSSLPYDPKKDFAPIPRVTTSTLVTVVDPSLPVRTFPEFVAWAGTQPQEISFASPASARLCTSPARWPRAAPQSA